MLTTGIKRDIMLLPTSNKNLSERVIKMIIKQEISLQDFEAWSGGEITLQTIIDEGKIGELESLLEELYPEGMEETQLNDILRFEDEWLFEQLGIEVEES